MIAVLIELNIRDLTRINHFEKVAVANLLHLPLQQRGKDERVQQHDHRAGDENIVDDRLAVGIVILDHMEAPF